MQHLSKGSWMGRTYVKCHGCGTVLYPRSHAEEQHFLAAHASHGAQMHAPVAQGYGGLGDAIANGTKALGIQPCTPCQQRQAMLNRAVPRVFRRRG